MYRARSAEGRKTRRRKEPSLRDLARERARFSHSPSCDFHDKSDPAHYVSDHYASGHNSVNNQTQRSSDEDDNYIYNRSTTPSRPFRYHPLHHISEINGYDHSSARQSFASLIEGRRSHHERSPHKAGHKDESNRSVNGKLECDSADDFIGRALNNLPKLDGAETLGWIWHGKKWIILCIFLGILGALVFSLATPHRYTVYTDIIVDPTNLQVVRNDLTPSNPIGDSQLLEVESKMRVLTSRNVLGAVIKELKLMDDDEFVKPPSIFSIREWLQITSQGSPAAPEIGAMRALSKRVEARRVPRSFVVTLSVYSEDSAKSMRISKAIVDAFKRELFRSSANSAGRVVSNLNERLEELRLAVSKAEDRMVAYQRRNGLLGTTIQSQELNTQRVSELNNQILEAQTSYLQAQARYEAMQIALIRGEVHTASSINSEAMVDLRSEYTSLRREVISQSQVLGSRHPTILRLKAQKKILVQSIEDEAKRIIGIAQSEMKQAKTTLDGLHGRLETERSSVHTKNEAEIGLRELQRDTQAKAAVYEAYLSRVQQIAERRQIDTTNIQVISEPVPPTARNWPPRTLLLLIAGSIGGGILGLILAFSIGGLGFLWHGPQARRQ